MEDLSESLREVGLGRYESSVYLGLLMDQSAKVSEISKRTGVPQPKAYQALDALVEKGFCTLGSDAVNRYRPLPPADALRDALVRLDQARARVNELGSRLEEIRVAGAGRERWAPPIEIIKGAPQVERFLRERLASAKREVLLFGKLPHLTQVDIVDALRGIAERGARLRVVAEQGYFDGDVGSDAARYAALTQEVRVVPRLPTKLLLIDREMAISSISPGGGRPLDLVLREAGLVEHFVNSFEQAWQRGQPRTATR